MNKQRTLNNTKLDDSDLDMFQIPSNQERLLRKEMVSTLYEYYLVGEIGEADQYLDLVDALRSAGENDQFIIRFNSGGGLLSTGDMIINAIKDTQAHVHGYIEHSCGSMATMLFLACHSWSLSESAEFFVHSASGGTVGKEHENYASVMFARKKLHKMVKNRYAGFLTEQEIENVLNGQDYYFDVDEIADRLDTYTEHHQKLFEEEMERLQQEELGDKPTKKKILPS